MKLTPSTHWLLSLAACAALLSTPATAGTQIGQVTELRTRARDNLIYFYLTGSASGRPACAAGYAYWMIKDENSATGKRQFAMLMSAMLAGKTVSVSGTGACTRWADGEDVEEVVLLP